ncbi:hypothetical protein FMUND_4284 [Fusarium mundagurra]|uniref:Uncharacterized protein n=1 Tax=Fusarium mundagurra TaxID=1567541 RepID=A0A8H6DMC1_9HYPO|nr:hypothetical protein FMUND_4284 [Fusarium mundagurra]
MSALSSNDLIQKPLRPITEVKSTPDQMEKPTDEERARQQNILMKAMMEQLKIQQSAALSASPEYMAKLFKKRLQPDTTSRL